MNAFYDALEQRSPDQREADLLAALPEQVAHAQAHSEAFAHILAGVDAHSVTSRAALAQLPVTRKHELLARQQAERANDVFGGFSALRFGAAMPRVFLSRMAGSKLLARVARETAICAMCFAPSRAPC
jgi:phenylacetate-CoA ligase